VDVTPGVSCPGCGAAAGETDAFCESCGTELTPPVVSTGETPDVAECPVCAADPSAGTSVVGEDGYCETCGRKAPSGRDHVELDLGALAGVTDRGIRHQRNEDAMALATADTPDGPVSIAVVCDGVSSAPRPDEASLAAARAAVRVLLAAVRTGDDPAEASRAAVHAATKVLDDLSGPAGAPSATYVSAVCGRDAVTLCWVGDSRAYWLAGQGSARLTTDDSLAGEMVEAGLLTEEAALASPQAHVITRWLGADLAEPRPHVALFEPPGPGVLLICSDGLWNYRPEAEGLARLALPAGLTDPLGTAGELVAFAIEAGGMDNITVVLVPFRGDSS
jgi:serine/threonine protein phosphatase PrpC